MLTDEQLTELRVLVGPGAWAAHDLLPSTQQVDTGAAFAVLDDLRLVAAEVLEAVAGNAGAGGASKVKLGPLELNLTSGDNVRAWLSRAQGYREAWAGSGMPTPELTPWDCL